MLKIMFSWMEAAVLSEKEITARLWKVYQLLVGVAKAPPREPTEEELEAPLFDENGRLIPLKRADEQKS